MREKTNSRVVVSPSTHYSLSLHSSLITSLGLAASAACHHMTCLYSPHKYSNWWLQCSSDPGHFRPVAGCHVEEGARRREWEEGDKEQMMASWLLTVRDSPLVLISWCYFEINPFACHYCVCRCKCVCLCVTEWNRRSRGWWVSRSLNRQSISYTLTLFQLIFLRWGENHLLRARGEDHFNPLNNVFPYLLPLCLCSRLLHILPVSPQSTDGCQTDLIHFVGDISCPSFNCLLSFLHRVLIMNSFSPHVGSHKMDKPLHLLKGKDDTLAVTYFLFYYFFNWKIMPRVFWIGKDIQYMITNLLLEILKI